MTMLHRNINGLLPSNVWISIISESFYNHEKGVKVTRVGIGFYCIIFLVWIRMSIGNDWKVQTKRESEDVRNHICT